MSYLKLEGLRKTYHGINAVEHLDISVERGEFLTLLGPSGCGKTTTLQMIAGFVEPSAGRISLDGTDLTRVPSNRRGLGIVFQSYALFPHMTAAENVAFGLQMRNVGRDEIGKRVAEALNLVGLGTKGGHYPRQLSGGQQQRVALARALVIQPKILLLDEPLSNLDAKMREEMQVELRQIQRNLGTTTVLVTHDQQEAMALSDRVVVMRAGNVEQIGAPFEVYERPATPFVASFLGKNNRFRGVAASGKITLAGHAVDGKPPADGAVDLDLRSEKITISDRGEGKLPGTITARVFQGNHWLLHVETPAGVATVIRQNDGTPAPAEGGSVGLSWNAADAIVRMATT